MFLRDFGWLSPDCTVLHSRRENSTNSMRLFKRKAFAALLMSMVIASDHVVACSTAQHQQSTTSSKWYIQFYWEAKKERKGTKRKKRKNEIQEGEKEERKGGVKKNCRVYERFSKLICWNGNTLSNFTGLSRVFSSDHRNVKTLKTAGELNGSVEAKRTSWWVYLASCVSHMVCCDDVLNTGWQVAVRTPLTASH